MDGTTKKIWEYVKSNKLIRDFLFYYTDNKNYNPWFDGQSKESLEWISRIEWVYISMLQQTQPIGIEADGAIVSIDDEGEFRDLGKGFENLPYEFLRWEMNGFDSLEEYLNYIPEGTDIRIALKEYEDWCKNNNVELDKNKIYHDENGNIFTKYFELT